MHLSHALFCATLSIFGVCSASIPFDQVKFSIFDNSQSHLVDSLVTNTLKSTEHFFANKNIANLVTSIETSTSDSILPFIRQLGSPSFALRNLLAKDGHWTKLFLKSIENEHRRGLALNDIHWMQSAIELFRTDVSALGDTSVDHNVLRKRTASFIHSDLDKMINLFAHQYSIFKRYPLIGAPILIEISLLIGIFEPIARAYIPLEVQNPQIACKALNTLLDYRPRTVSARLEKIHSNNTLFVSTLAAVRQLQYNRNGYNRTVALQCQKIDEHRSFSPSNNSLTDEFGYFIPHHSNPSCFNDYASYVRHEVEKMFPVRFLERVCVYQNSNIPKRYGWLTIQIRNIRAYGLTDGSSCDVTASSVCDPYVKLFINNEKVIQTKPIENLCCLDANVTYQSIKIPKKSSLKIEVWDDDSGFFGSADDLVQSSEGSIDSFIKTPIRSGAVFATHQNLIETIVFWQDEL